MSAGVHPYFAAKAMAVMRDAGADPRDAGELASWAQQVFRTERARFLGVLVDKHGHLVCETERDPETGAFYAVDGPYCGYLWDWAAAYWELETGVPVVHVKAWQVCSGQRAAVAA